MARFALDGATWTISGCTTAVEGDETWVVGYVLRVDEQWRTRSAHVRGLDGAGESSLTLESDGAGRWTIDGTPAPHLEGCLDVDLESSAMTNTLPVHRLGLAEGVPTPAPAAYVRALGLGVDRLEQTYRRVADDGPHQRYDYTAEAFGFAARLVYDAAGLVVAYPGIAVRAA